MEDLLILQERVKNTISLGESHFREFKTALEGQPENKRPRLAKKICEDIAEALVSFANADGGEVLIGVEDDGSVTGIPHGQQDVDMMLSSIKTHVYNQQKLPLIIVSKLIIDGENILYFAVSKGTTMIYQLPDGRCVRRKDRETLPASVDQIQFERQEIRSRQFDSEFVDGATVNDLDVSVLQGIADQYIRGLSVEKYLQQVGLGEYGQTGLRLRRASLLLFAKNIQRWHPRSQVRFLKITGTRLESGENYNVVSDEIESGNIFDLILKAWESLRPYLAFKTEFGNDSKFEQRYTYPEDACREALLNAIAHRDYSTQNGIEVYIFNDRMEIKNPGALLSTLSVANIYDLEGSHESRNPLIARVLRENKLMRELGEGMKRIFELMQLNDLEKPKLFSNGSSFTIVLLNKSVYSTKQEEWLKLFDRFNLSKNQKRIMLLGQDGKAIAPNNIYKAMNTNDRDTYDREITGLRNKGLLLEIRSNLEAGNLAKSTGRPKSEIARFKVRLP